MGQVAGEVGMRAAGDLAQQMGWEEGSKEKAILHGAVGAAIAALGGGNVLQGLAGAAASQLATLAMQGYLRDNNIDPNSAEGKALMALGSAAVGAAVGDGSGASTALAGEQFNRQLHLSEAERLEGLKQGKSAEEQQRLNDAACALVRCATGVPDSDPNKAALLASQQRGADYTAEQALLKQGGGFEYGKWDATNDWLLSHDEALVRGGGAVQAVGGAAGAVGGTAGAVATSPACATIVGCVAPVGLGAVAVLSAKQGMDGLNQALADYRSDIGQRVIESFNPVTYPGESNRLADLGVDGLTFAAEMLIGKIGGKLLTEAPATGGVTGKTGTNLGGTPDHLLPESIRGDGMIAHPVKAAGVDELLKLGGGYVGHVNPGATPNIRAVTPAEFTEIQNGLLQGAKPVGTYAQGNGTWYSLPGGGRVGVRTSAQSGVTLDINIPGYPPGFKVHQNE